MTKSRLLMILLLLLLISSYYAWQQSPRPQTVAERNRDKRHQVPVEKVKPGGNSGRLDFSGGEKLPFKEPLRDPFRALYRPQKVEIKQVTAPPPPPRTTMPPRNSSPAPVISRPSESISDEPKPIPALRVLGFLEQKGERRAFLTSLSGDVYVLKQGERFADNLLVRELTGDKIVISRGPLDPGKTLLLGGPRQQRIKVVGGPPSRPNIPVSQDFDVNVLQPRKKGSQDGETEEAVENPASQ